jgi:hypothetical protein
MNVFDYFLEIKRPTVFEIFGLDLGNSIRKIMEFIINLSENDDSILE